MGYAVPVSTRSTFSQITKDPHLPLGRVMLENRKVFGVLGLTDPLAQRLGVGAFGAAYRTPLAGGSVLKFTRDPTEMQAASVLCGKATERVVRIYGLWAIPNTFTPKLRPWYLIHRGYLNPLSKYDADRVEMLFSLRFDKSIDLKLPRAHHHAMRDKWRTYIRAEMAEDTVTDEEGRARTFNSKDVQKTMALLEEISLAVNEMYQHGVDWQDFHNGNMMRGDKGQLVIGDIGWGELRQHLSMVAPPITEDVARAYAGQPALRLV